jgi:hypothetical protein
MMVVIHHQDSFARAIHHGLIDADAEENLEPNTLSRPCGRRMSRTATGPIETDHRILNISAVETSRDL